MDKCCKVAALFLATLRAIEFIARQNHWLTKGSSFYGDHLLFERIYNSVSENIDSAAEKFVGLFGEQCLEYDTQVDLLNKVLLKYKNLEGSPMEMLLAIEKDFLNLSKNAYNCFENENKLSLGLDDTITSISSKQEESVYLLQQTLSKGFKNA